MNNPFYESYIQADLLGKLIFLSLFAASVISWSLIIYKAWICSKAKREAARFLGAFTQSQKSPLSLQIESSSFNPFQEIYGVLKKQTLDLLSKNRQFSPQQTNHLSTSDIDVLQSHLFAAINFQTLIFERNLYILSTIVALAPFLGLLGTVWGILIALSEMQTSAMAASNQVVLGGLSLALATTVLGLIDAIPAVIGYNYLKNEAREFSVEMEGFANTILANVELQYRKVDLD